MRKIKTILAMMIFTVALVGCSSEVAQEELKATMSMEELAQQIQQEVEFEMMMPVDINDEMQAPLVTDATGLDLEWIVDGAFYPNMMITADTIFLAEAKGEEEVEFVVEAFERQKQGVIDSFEMYLPEPYEVAQDGQVVTKGNYIMLVISEDNEAAIQIFEDAIQ